MGSSSKWVRAGVLGLTTCLGLGGAVAAGAAVSHDGHAAGDGAAVHQPAGPLLQDKMSKAIEQIEREVQTKGPFRGASAHAMQQGVLLVADDPDKVQVSQGARCPAQAPVRAYDVTAMNVEITPPLASKHEE